MTINEVTKGVFHAVMLLSVYSGLFLPMFIEDYSAYVYNISVFAVVVLAVITGVHLHMMRRWLKRAHDNTDKMIEVCGEWRGLSEEWKRKYEETL